MEYEEVEEGAMPTSRYSSYSNKKPSRAWGIEETRLFYQALRQCGTEFSMMQTFFPHRTRRELKLKFRREEGAHPELIKNTLFSQLPLGKYPHQGFYLLTPDVVGFLFCFHLCLSIELVPFEVSLGVDLTADV
ncbi:hypothetical protein EON65_06635 [archaeon]|nr:MAG: hypothetical protein EON65_06635 [archaeon]